MAEVKLKISAEDKASAVIEKMVANGTNASDRLSGAFERLNIKSSSAYDQLRSSATSAYDKIKSSGVVTADELTRAGKAHAVEMTRIDEEQYGKRASLLQKFKANWLGITASITAAYVAAQQAWNLADLGAKGLQQRQSFGNLAASKGMNADAIIADLRRISGETIATQKMIESAGTAMLLGVEGKMLPKLMEISRAASRITGQSITESFGSLSLGIARQSKLLLDNLGIIIDVEKANEAYAKANHKTAASLTETERKQAFMNATVERGQEMINAIGVSGMTAMEKLQRVGATMENVKEVAGRGVLATFTLVQAVFQGTAAAALLLASGLASVVAVGAKMTGAKETAAEFKLFAGAYYDAAMDLGQKAHDSLTSSWDLLSGKLDPINAKLAALQQKAAADKLAAAEKEAEKIREKEAAEARAKQLAEIQSHNDKIIDLYKKRIKTSLDLETAHLKTLTDKYGEAVSAMDRLIDARTAVKDQLAARNAADLVKNRGDSDPINAYLDQQQEIFSAEKKLGESFGMTAEAKAKAYADLIDKAASYNRAVMDGSTELVSSLQTEYDYQENKERLQEKINKLFEEESAKRTTAAETFAEQMITAQDRVSAFQGEMTALETVLDRLNNKEITLIFKAQGIGEIYSAFNMVGAASPSGELPMLNMEDLPQSGRRSYGDYYTQGGKTYWNDGSLADEGTGFVGSFASGTPYVPRTGLALIHQGERIIPAAQNRAGAASTQTITIAPTIHINGVSASGRDKTARELAREIAPHLDRLAQRRF